MGDISQILLRIEQFNIIKEHKKFKVVINCMYILFEMLTTNPCLTFIN